MELVITPWIESSCQHRESSPQGIYTGNTINLLTPSCDHRHNHLPLCMKNYNHDMQKNQKILRQIKIFSALKNNCQIIEHDLAVLCAHFWISQKNFFASTWLGSFFGATVLFGRICSKFTPCFKHWTGICSVGIWYCISWQAAELGAASCLEHATWPFVYLDHN